MIYTQVSSRGGHEVLSPADACAGRGLAGSGQFRQLDMYPDHLPPASGNSVSQEEDAEDLDDEDQED